MKQTPMFQRLLSTGLAGLMLLQGMALPALAAEPPAEEAPQYPYLDTSLSFEERAADLVARMSLEQKGSQMISNNSAAIPASELGGGALNVPATKGTDSYT